MSDEAPAIIGKIRDLEEERGKLRFRAATEDVDKPSRFREIRRDIARVKTVLTERAKGA